MDANTITTLIGAVGFPIVAYMGMFYYMTKRDETREEENKQDKELLLTALTNNTTALAELSALIRKQEDATNG